MYRIIEKPYSVKQLEMVEQAFDIVFPPEYRAFLLARRFVGDGCIDRCIMEEIEYALTQPLDGVIDDILDNDIWLPQRGIKQYTEKDELLEYFATVPKLLPLCGHRYMPSGVSLSMPVFSVMQSDVIVYGRTFDAYLCTDDFGGDNGDDVSDVDCMTHDVYIPFRSDLVYASW